MPTSYSSNPLAAWPALSDDRSLLRVGPVAALASASEYLKPPSTLAHRIITRDYHRSSASPNIRARKLGASDQPRKVGSGRRLRCRCHRDCTVSKPSATSRCDCAKSCCRCARAPAGAKSGSWYCHISSAERAGSGPAHGAFTSNRRMPGTGLLPEPAMRPAPAPSCSFYAVSPCCAAAKSSLRLRAANRKCTIAHRATPISGINAYRSASAPAVCLKASLSRPTLCVPRP